MAKITIINKSGVELHGLKPNGKRKIDVDDMGTPYDINWQRRFRDKNIEVYKEEKVVKEKKVVKETKPNKEDKD